MQKKTILPEIWAILRQIVCARCFDWVQTERTEISTILPKCDYWRKPRATKPQNCHSQTVESILWTQRRSTVEQHFIAFEVFFKSVIQIPYSNKKYVEPLKKFETFMRDCLEENSWIQNLDSKFLLRGKFICKSIVLMSLLRRQTAKWSIQWFWLKSRTVPVFLSKGVSSH